MHQAGCSPSNIGVTGNDSASRTEAWWEKRRQRDKGKEGLVIELALRMSHFNREVFY